MHGKNSFNAGNDPASFLTAVLLGIQPHISKPTGVIIVIYTEEAAVLFGSSLAQF
jgi:hypothetical protein